MNEQAERLFRAIGYVGDDLIARADFPVPAQKTKIPALRRWAALAACCALVIGIAAYCLPRLDLGATSEAPESAVEFAATTESAPRMEGFEKEEMKTEDATEEAAAECAPAEAESQAALDKNNETGSSAAGSQEDMLLSMRVGPVCLGMPAEEVYALLGAPLDGETDFSDAVEIGTLRYCSWKYNLSGDTNYICDVSLSMADAGEGFVVDEIMTFGTSDWETERGIHNGSSAEDVAAAYPDAQEEYDADGASSRYVLRAGHTELSFPIENGAVRNICLGTFYQAPAWEETVQAAPAYSFAGSEIFVYSDTPDGRTTSRLSGERAKRLEVILGIEALKPLETPPEAAHYLDFGNGTIVMLGEDQLSGAVYHCEALEEFREVMAAGEDPLYLLELLESCTFPEGTDEVLNELLG